MNSELASHNLFSALRAAFPQDMAQTAVEATAPDGSVLRYSWRDLEQASARIANLLASLGLPEGSRIAVQVEKSVEAMQLYLATLRAGYVFLPLNTAYQRAEISYFIGNAEPAVVVCTPENFAWVSQLAYAAGTQHVFTLGDDRTGSLLERAAQQDDAHVPVHKTADDLAAILYTSGTTGRSKGAMLTHGNLLSNARVLKDYWGWRSDDVLIHALPIFHVHGLFVAIHAALLGGSKMIWLPKFDPKAVIAAMPRATVFMGVPTLYVRMLAEPTLNHEAARSMRLFISGSAPLLVETFRAWQERTGHTILERYGMSETIMLTSNPYGADARYGGQSERRGGTVGFPLPGVELRVVDDANAPLAEGEIGNIQVRGPNVFKGYWRMPEKTAEEFTADGWFKTGDVGKIDGRGYVSIVGRSKDLIISGGYNVYPAEVEAAINDLPGVAESAVVGVPHPDFGEVGVAVVVAKPGTQLDPEAILAQLKSQLANYKIPKRCVIVPELPRNTMGKVQKNLLRAEHQNMFGA
ncbi:malonate--CoA ligase [Extensimonas vulgaris]|uniref:Malonyl-CoA/methylmalonyl-CoA synthetase n=1 Tax=Extensimonas vulgaris TaxID=1031594 RepID=A0A369AR46_9BURK|nr:malonyl-CoA synthase [Extensimonas vulgaris]RCX11585.1 malonyl-CoA/methylmalonyl-CoA synthetase [Extensimonas vulgaris]TWI40480.1 malonyl-CoA/methylmalonyl-CoA synthetase [Extensimonas vulgaris]TXD16502.1 malonyl-CoA synthase [Extensimonas vulgaris]